MIIRPCIVAGVALIACSRVAPLPSAKAIRDSLNAAWTSPADSVVSIRRLVPGSWTEVYLFASYTPREVIATCVGTSVDTDGIEMRDDIDLWIIRRSDGSVASRDISRGSPALDTAAASAVYDTSATFRSQSSRSGDWRVIAPRKA